MNTRIFFAAILLFSSFAAFAQTPTPPPSSDEDAIRATAHNYVEGWYEGNADRMERALSPDLVKRIVHTDAAGHSRIDNLSALGLVQLTRAGYGKKTPVGEQIKNVKVLDTFGNAAMVRAEMRDWIDYMQMAKFNGEWKIINVLWELKPKK
jgi:hypothetical protein